MASVTKDKQTTIIKNDTDGSMTINLVLTIKLDSDGLSIAGPQQEQQLQNQQLSQDDKVDLEIPDFDDDMDLIDFGKKE